MGMDLVGVFPSSEKGQYFRANIWYWRPLWGYIEENFSDIACKVESPYTNEGYGLDADNSIILAQEIHRHVHGGLAKDYERNWNNRIAALSLIDCSICNGSGNREWPEGITREWIEQCNGCNVCHGTGLERPFESWYHFSVEVLEEFSQFLEHCGGFEIW